MPKQKTVCQWTVPLTQEQKDRYEKAMAKMGYSYQANFIREMVEKGILETCEK